MGGAPVAFDEGRKPDENNPLGYFELEGGRIIKKLMERKFDFKKYDNKFIKITAYGLKFLPKGKYKIIYMVRNMDEIFKSMEKMAGTPLSENEKIALTKLNGISLKLLESRKDIDFIVVKYNDVIKNPKEEIKRVNNFLGGILDINSAVEAVEKKLYRNRANK